MHLQLAALVVEDYDEAITFFVEVLGFELAEDSPSLTNTIVAANTGGDVTGTTTGGNNVIGVDPKLSPLGDYGGPTQTMPLQNGSCAIDAGPETSTLTADQRGLPRPVGSKTDIGAVEKQGADDPPPDTIFASGFES